MADTGKGYPKFVNDTGARTIRIGAKEFACMGATPPHDHPHVYLDMGAEADIICPYCGTHYLFDGALGRLASDPDGCFFALEEGKPARAS